MKKDKGHNVYTDPDDKEIEKYFNSLARELAKTLTKLHEKMGFCNGTIESLMRLIDNEPTIFAYSQYPENRNFLKFILQENIEQFQKFYDRIVALEYEYNLPTENEGDPELENDTPPPTKPKQTTAKGGKIPTKPHTQKN